MASDDSQSNLVRIHSDAPAMELVRSGFDSYTDTLAGLIANNQNETPLVIGIYGHWGSGKTTLMKAIQARLDGAQQVAELANRLGATEAEIRHCKTIWFQAWKYDKESEILAGLLEAIFQAMTSDDFFSFDSVLHWGIIEHAFPLLAEDLEDNPDNLFTLKDHLGALIGKMEHQRIWEADDTLLKDLNVPQSLHKYIRNEAMTNILLSFTIDKEPFIELLTFSASVESDETVEVVQERKQVGEPTDSMVEVPAGSFKFGEKPDDAEIEKPFWMDIYLVTNARFKSFIQDGGYETEKWWTPEGWKWRENERVLRPGFWDDAKFNVDDHPVVGVSWYEAVAFCGWLTDVSKDGFTYHLPDEKQWERAARGTDGRDYPWEGKFDPKRCNTRASNIGKTTRVDRYANGVSPVGCYDMAGNVWEWTSDYYDDDQNTYVIKGGSWSVTAEYARCAPRLNFYPGIRLNDVGFRCARTQK